MIMHKVEVCKETMSNFPVCGISASIWYSIVLVFTWSPNINRLRAFDLM